MNILALWFMVPKLLWTHIEGGVMKFIRGGSDGMTSKERRDKLLKVSNRPILFKGFTTQYYIIFISLFSFVCSL